MITTLSIEQLVELKRIFEELVKKHKIKYINFREEIIPEEKKLQKSLEHYEMLITWFKIYDGQIIQTKKQIGYDDIMKAIQLPELIHLKHWISGQKARLSSKRMQPHEYILLKLSGIEFKTKENKSELQMLNYIQNSNLHIFVNEENQIIAPKRLILNR